ncbi:DUF6221 family protein [Streptomyces sp. NPDC088719]|uniref:DUF6221 family protein n=1 Tax=Streptomyces sp. NPDC088719 TaxID=3365872 RepID=UPI00382A0504
MDSMIEHCHDMLVALPVAGVLFVVIVERSSWQADPGNIAVVEIVADSLCVKPEVACTGGDPNWRGLGPVNGAIRGGSGAAIAPGATKSLHDAQHGIENVHMAEELVRFIEARLDKEADLDRRCDADADGCGEWSAHGHTVDFCQVDLAGFHPTIALHVALHDPARVLREIEAKRRILARHARDPWPCHGLRDLASPYAGHPDFPARLCSGSA